MRRALTTLGLLWGCSTVHSEAPHAASTVAHDPSVESGPRGAALEAAREAVLRAEQLADQERSCRRWPLWERYAQQFISAEGRVIDHTSDGRTTSEGQAYGLFFALVARDRERFELLLRWSEQNLAQGDLGAHLPAWHWGKRDDGSWGIKDPNAASDADVWMAYALFEAARLFEQPRYATIARGLSAQIAAHEVVEVEGLGSVLLPGPQGFVAARGTVRLNPSYLALPPLRGLEREHKTGPWRAVLASSVKILRGGAPHGIAPDWIAYTAGKGFSADATTASLGSYDAIRVYLWAALAPDEEPHARVVRAAASGLHRVLERIGRVPERMDARSEAVSDNDGPPGFVAVALADAHARGDGALQRELGARLNTSAFDGLYGNPPAYFDQNLALFARGLLDGLYRFQADGQLLLARDDDACVAL